MADMSELEVAGIRMLDASDQPVLVLRVKGTTQYLPVWVDTVAAAALMSVFHGDDGGAARTFDLCASLLDRLQATSVSGCITGWEEGIFTAELIVDGESIDCRVSDLAGLVLLRGIVLRCPQELVAQVSVEAFDGGKDIVKEFKNFLNNVSPDDFEI